MSEMGLTFNSITHIVISPPFTSQLDVKKASISNHLVNVNDKIIRFQQSCFVHIATKWHSALGSDTT